MHAFGDRGRRTLHSLSFQGRLRNAMEMTGAALRAICKENKLYETPELNETLYCNHRGFISVAELEPYSGLRALFLDNNALDTLDGVPALPELRCLCASPCIASERQAVACFANPATRRVCLTECYPAPQVRAVQHVDGRSRPQPAGQPGHAQRQQQQRVHPRCARARSLTSASGATNRATPRSLAAWVLLRVDHPQRLAAGCKQLHLEHSQEVAHENVHMRAGPGRLHAAAHAAGRRQPPGPRGGRGAPGRVRGAGHARPAGEPACRPAGAVAPFASTAAHSSCSVRCAGAAGLAPGAYEPPCENVALHMVASSVSRRARSAC